MVFAYDRRHEITHALGPLLVDGGVVGAGLVGVPLASDGLWSVFQSFVTADLRGCLSDRRASGRGRETDLAYPTKSARRGAGRSPAHPPNRRVASFRGLPVMLSRSSSYHSRWCIDHLPKKYTRPPIKCQYTIDNL